MRERTARYVTKLMRTIATEVVDIQVIRSKRIKIPLVAGLRCSPYEKWMVDVLDFVLEDQPGVFLDIGVNLGQTLIKLRSLEHACRYVGFEPNPICVFYVSELIRMNGYSDCTIVPVGLFTETALLTLNMFIATPTDPAASLIREFRADQKVLDTKLVPVFRFEELAPKLALGKVGVVKIDVEGAELEVLVSLRAELERSRPVVLLEVLPAYSDSNLIRIERQKAIEQLLAELEYTMFRVLKTADDEYKGIAPMAAFDIHSDIMLCDYVAVPLEHAERVLRASLRFAR